MVINDHPRALQRRTQPELLDYPRYNVIGYLDAGAAKTVHPSLRPVAQNMLRVLAQDFPGIALHGDMDADSWTAKRGEQTIHGKTA